MLLTACMSKCSSSAAKWASGSSGISDLVFFYFYVSLSLPPSRLKSFQHLCLYRQRNLDLDVILPDRCPRLSNQRNIKLSSFFDPLSAAWSVFSQRDALCSSCYWSAVQLHGFCPPVWWIFQRDVDRTWSKQRSDEPPGPKHILYDHFKLSVCGKLKQKHDTSCRPLT